jgi:hypothetical protein
MSTLTPAISHNDLNQEIHRLNVIVREFCGKLNLILDKNTPHDLRSAYKFAFKTTLYLQTTAYESLGALYFTFRGSIWHYLLALVSLAMALENMEEGDCEKYIENWVKGYSDLLKNLPTHLYNTTNKSYPDMNDPMVNSGLEEANNPE